MLSFPLQIQQRLVLKLVHVLFVSRDGGLQKNKNKWQKVPTKGCK